MTKKITLAFITFLSFTATQAQIYIGANAGINNTKLYNVSDAKADERLDYVMTLKPQFGITIGYPIKDKLSIELQPQLYTIGQKYKGSATDAVNSYSLTASVNLQYIKIPLYFKYTFTKPTARLSYHFMAGANIAVMNNYTEQILYDRVPNLFNGYLKTTDVAINNLNVEYTQTNVVGTQTTVSNNKALMDKSFFNKLNFGANLGVGFNFKVTSKISLHCNVLGELGLNNVENKDTLKFLDPQTNQPLDSYASSVLKDSKYNEASKSTDVKRSVITNTRAIGLQVGLTYNLGKKDANKAREF